jgi:nitroreductase
MPQTTAVFKNTFDQLVTQRYSCRSFSSRLIEAHKLSELTGFMKSSSTLFPGAIRLEMINKRELKRENLFTTGAYGMIKGFNTFIAGIMGGKTPTIWVDFGTLMQRSLMFATDLDLNTCWVGGIFDRKTIGRVTRIHDHETVPAIIALGYASEKKTIRDRITRWGSRGDRRKPPEELFFKENPHHPFELSRYPLYARLLENVRLAPSASNKQPWRIIFQSRQQPIFHFYLCRDKIYSKLIPGVDLQQIDMGIAAFHFQQSALENGLEMNAIRKNPELLNLPEHYQYIISFAVID